jgi:hypothetical protein
VTQFKGRGGKIKRELSSEVPTRNHEIHKIHEKSKARRREKEVRIPTSSYQPPAYRIQQTVPSIQQ